MDPDWLPLVELRYQLIRDPETYRQDFQKQLESFVNLIQSFSCAPSQYISRLDELLLFLSQTISFYPDFMPQFSSNVLQTLLSRAFGMHPDMRMAVMRMRSKGLLSVVQMVDISFKIYRCKDKQARETLRSFLISDIKKTNKNNKCPKVNGAISDSDTTIAKEAVLILLSLFKKNVWNDARTANLIGESCLTKSKKVYVPAVKFFIGKDNEPSDSDSDSDSDVKDETKIKQLRVGHRVGNKTKNRQKRLDRSIKNLHKTQERKVKRKCNITNFHAINLLYDPHSFAEKLFQKLQKCGDRFEIRILLLDLISKLIGLNKLLLLNFYPYIQRYLRPQQREATQLLLFSAQASHDQIPPDIIEAVVRAIADNFITERASSEAIAVGLNSVREICSRCPYALNKDLLSDLINYTSYRNKNVVSAARSIIRLYRQLNPNMLPRKERGRLTECQADIINEDIQQDVAINFGQSVSVRTIPGSEIVAMAEVNKKMQNKKPKKTKLKKTDDVVMKSEDNNEEDDDTDDDDDNDESDAQSAETDDEEMIDADDDSGDGESSDEDGWVDVSSSDSNDEEIVKNSGRIDPNLLKSRAMELASDRIFTQEEFQAMRKYHQSKQKRFASYSSLKSGNAVDDSCFDVGSDSDADGGGDQGQNNLVSMSAILRLAKRPRQSKAERMESIEQGRIAREKYGYKVNRMNAHASTTNREKSKNKAFGMIKHKVKQKAKRSFHEKQLALRKHLTTLAKQSR